MLTLLGNLFAWKLPLSRTFLSQDFVKLPSKPAVEVGCVKGGHECNVKIFVRKSDKKILYAECSEDFVDSLLGLLALPLELAWSLTDGSVLGFVGNLCRSECREASASTPLEIPYYYTCSKQILDIPPQPTVVYSYPYTFCDSSPVLSFVRNVKNLKNSQVIIAIVIPVDPKIGSQTHSKCDFGYVKRDMRFIVSDGLVITPMSSSSTIGLFMRSHINNISDLEEQEINISKAEVCLYYYCFLVFFFVYFGMILVP